MDPYVNVYNTYNGAVPSGNFSTPYQQQPWLMVSFSLHVVTFLFIAHHLINRPTKAPCQHTLRLRIESIAELKLKLMDDFQEFVSSMPNFQVGFIEGRSTQQWMVAREDLNTMYASAKDDEITLVWQESQSIGAGYSEL